MVAGEPGPGNGGCGGPTTPDFFQAALEVRAWGWSTFPLRDNKRPRLPWKRWQNRRPSDRDLARMFCGRSGIGGLAVVPGPVSGGTDWGLAVRDFDRFEAYRRW